MENNNVKCFKVDGYFIPKTYDKNSDAQLQLSEISVWCKDNDLKYDKENKKIVSAAGDYSEYDIENKLDDKKYSLESLKNRYPDSKYDIRVRNRQIIVKNKSTGKRVIIISKGAKGTYIDMFDKDGKSVYLRNYDKNGNLNFYDKDGQRYYPIADDIYAAVSAKKGKLIPTTDVNKLVSNIRKISPENILEIAKVYEETFGESILDSIENEWGLDERIKNNLIQHLNKCIYENMKKLEEAPNCEIDNCFQQGSTGDCWFLSSIAAIQRSPRGQEILDNMITDNHDGTYTVKFKGADGEYKVNAFELLGNNNLASGDLDVKILELAAQKHYTLGINCGNPASAMELLLGTGDKWKNVVRVFSQKLDPQKIRELLNNENIVMTAAITPISKLYGLIMKNVPKEAEYKEDIDTAHGYAVVDIDDKNIYLKNPWNTDKTIAIPMDVFEDYWDYVQYTEIK